MDKYKNEDVAQARKDAIEVVKVSFFTFGVAIAIIMGFFATVSYAILIGAILDKGDLILMFLFGIAHIIGIYLTTFFYSLWKSKNY
jgi:uncharacterized membrane protein